MRPARPILIAAFAAAGVLCSAAAAQESSVAQLEKQVRDNPTSLKAKADLAEAYLRDCDLEKSLAVWRQVLAADPNHKRARYVVQRLTLQALDLDSHLDVLQTLIEKGITRDVSGLLDAAGERAAGEGQKARILYLRGLLAVRRSAEAAAPRPALPPAARPPALEPATSPAPEEPAKEPSATPKANPLAFEPDPVAVSSFQAAIKLYPDTAWAGWSAIALADLERRAGRGPEARRLLAGVIENAKLPDKAVKESARLALVELAGAGLTDEQKVAALREALAGLTVADVRRRALEALAEQIRRAHGGWSPASVEALGQALATNPPYDQAVALLGSLSDAARSSQDAATLDAVRKVAREVKPADPGLAREAALLGAEAAIARAVVEQDAGAVKALLADARRQTDALAAGRATYADRQRLDDLGGRMLLVEAQKLLALAGPLEASPVLLKAKDHYLAAIPTDPDRSLERLARIASLLEDVQEPQTAIALYREITAAFPYTTQGRDALLRVARIHERTLDAPMMALDAYVEYAARYPAELPYRQLAVGARLQRLGFANVLDFQKRNRLKVDGIFGPNTDRTLRRIEAEFDRISLGPDSFEQEILRGAFVHPMIYKIARGLADAGRHHEAIGAYRMFLNLFPTKAQADDALLSVARLFRENLLFEEALGAYDQLIEDYPKGDQTSEAYIEAAGCLENLGRWKEASTMYELYARKFPNYKHVGLCKTRLGLLGQIRQYEDFIAENPKNPKVPEAQYQIATILYQELGNFTKAAVEFVKVADAYPTHARAPEGLFTAGTAQLRAGNFPEARRLFERLVKQYPQSRLADDGQYWIGHTWEFAARAIGRLDDKRIVLKTRSLQAQEQLLADMALRREYNPHAQPGARMPRDVWGGETLGVLTSGSKRDRVNADLYTAIRAYRKVADDFKMGDMVGSALLRIGTIYIQYLKDPPRGIQAYQELLAHHPTSKEAVDALYEVGAYYLDNKQYDQAIKAYQQLVYNYPTHPKVEDGMLAIAKCHMEKKNWNQALDAFQSYLAKYPKGKHAEFAKAQIEWIRMYHF